MKYYGYIRVSTQTQAEHGQGLDTRLNAIEEYANNNNLPLSAIFAGAGIKCPITDALTTSYNRF